MQFSFHQAALPPVLQILASISAILDKAAKHCEARKIDPTVLLNYRLAPDMFPLVRQVQVMTDQAKGMAARLAGLEVPTYADTETSFADLKARIAKTVDFVKSVDPAAVDAGADRDITLKAGGNEFKFKGSRYLTGWVFPNFYFHATTTYDILRHCGVELGKRDFLGVA
jgi:uncharacterized protein